MVATAPEIYKKYATVNRKGVLVLYIEAINALYGIMKAALLFYIKFVENLKSIGSSSILTIPVWQIRLWTVHN